MEEQRTRKLRIPAKEWLKQWGLEPKLDRREKRHYGLNIKMKKTPTWKQLNE